MKTKSLLMMLSAIILASCSGDPNSTKQEILKNKTEAAVKKNLKDASSYQFISFDTTYMVNVKEIIDKRVIMQTFPESIANTIDMDVLMKVDGELKDLTTPDVEKFNDIIDEINTGNNSGKPKYKWALIKFNVKGELGNEIPITNIVSYFETFKVDADSNNLQLMNKEEVDLYLKALYEYRSKF